jgi:hypothetical protein
MLTDPQSITIATIATSLPAVRIEATKTVYQSAAGDKRLIVSYDDKTKNATRYLIRYEEDAVSADPISAVNAKKTLACYMVIEQPAFGFTDARVDEVMAGLKALVDSTLLLKVLGNQH